jgi:predicted CoA-binding protein
VLTTPSITDLLEDPTTTVAVVGATDTPGKYGGIIYRDLKAKGFTVFAVNPAAESVDGDPAYATLADLPETPTIVNVVVNPWLGRRVLRKALELGLMNVWLQPGAENDELVAFLDENGFNYLANACIMVKSRAPA